MFILRKASGFSNKINENTIKTFSSECIANCSMCSNKNARIFDSEINVVMKSDKSIISPLCTNNVVDSLINYNENTSSTSNISSWVNFLPYFNDNLINVWCENNIEKALIIFINIVILVLNINNLFCKKWYD